jgi:hypothetical protein
LQGKREFGINIAGDGWRTGCVARSLSYEINSPTIIIIIATNTHAG